MEPIIGEVRMFSGDYVPKGWALCDGSILPIRSNSALFSILGITYGGDGVNNFALPDFRSRAPMHRGTTSILGQRTGNAQIDFKPENLPPHTHVVQSASASATLTIRCKNEPTGGTLTQSPKGNYPGNSSVSTDDKGYSLDRNAGDYLGNSAVSVKVGTTGASSSVSNMMPYLAVKFIIAITGIYPPRS